MSCLHIHDFIRGTTITLPLAILNQSMQLLNRIAVNGRLADTDLEPVVVGRVVASSYLDPTHQIQMMNGEVHERRRAQTDVDDVDTGRTDRRLHDLVVLLARQPAVATDCDPRDLLREKFGPISAAGSSLSLCP